MNTLTVAVFAPILVIVGILGFVVPPEKASTSGAPRYNIFHILFGSLGILLVIGGNHAAIRTFNIGFGAIDLCQFVASRRHWWPEKHFRWKKMDDLLHVVIGFVLVGVGLFF